MKINSTSTNLLPSLVVILVAISFVSWCGSDAFSPSSTALNRGLVKSSDERFRGRKYKSAAPIIFSQRQTLSTEQGSAVITESSELATATSPGQSGSETSTEEIAVVMDVMKDMDTTTTLVMKEETPESEYQRGLATIGFITLIFASNSPVLHAAFVEESSPPPVLLLNAAISIVAMVGLLLGGESLESNTPLPSSLSRDISEDDDGSNAQSSSSSSSSSRETLRGGLELGLWKSLGTTANLYGLSLTTAGHGAFLVQLTTLIVPVVQGLRGVRVPIRTRCSIVLALAGVVCFTRDASTTTTTTIAGPSSSALGDALCVVAALFYAAYDLRLFEWGKRVAPRSLVTTKIATQATLSTALLLAVDARESWDYLSSTSWFVDGGDPRSWLLLPMVVLWSGVAVNAVAPFLQVGGQQAIGPTRCQTIYASQPLWAAILSYFALGETIGANGVVGGTAFLTALFLAASAPEGDEESDCESTNSDGERER